MAEIKVRGESKISLIPIYRINENISFPMRTYTKQQIIPLAESISHNGILQPLIVRKNSSHTYELISGKRRLQAAVMAGKTSVPCIIIHCSKSRSLLYSLAENFQRSEYSYIEKVRIINILIHSYGYTVEKISELFGNNEAEVESLLKLNRYTDKDLFKIEKNGLSFDTALFLSGIKDDRRRTNYLNRVISENLSVQDLKEMTYSITEKKDNRKIIIKDMKVFHNSINKILEAMRLSGINPLESKTENNDYILYVIRIPKR